MSDTDLWDTLISVESWIVDAVDNLYQQSKPSADQLQRITYDRNRLTRIIGQSGVATNPLIKLFSPNPGGSGDAGADKIDDTSEGSDHAS